MPLLLSEARERSALIDVTSYDVTLDLDSGEQTFESASVIRFTSGAVGAETFLDVKAQSVHSITLNDKPIDVDEVRGGRVALRGLHADNKVTVVATMAYSHDGQGLHRSVDPADEQAYVYGMSFLDAAPQVFACFDQPDLKAPYTFRVKAPADWSVVGNTATAGPQEDGWWHLPTTKPLSTYFVCICAGPYAVERDSHDGIPLVIHARASLASELEAQAPQMFEVTKQGLDYYQDLFGIAYPWGEYHQFFVPEFNAGAMENPGCVTFRDSMIFRGAITRAALFQRTNTITHEMAHMWFGDLVTPVWWDDLWLNESFAEYMAHRSCAEATEFSEAWVDFGIARKNWGYGADRAPSTHPIAGAPAPDSDAALTNFDGISYAKGASALRQLAAYVGDDAFIAGVRDHLNSHAYGNATLADFLGAIERASDRDLSAWAAGWLETSGTDQLTVALEGGDTITSARITSATITRTAPAQFPADRPHVLDVAAFKDGEPVWRLPALEVTSSSQQLTGAVGQPSADLVVPNASDLTWGLVQFDEATLAALPAQLGRIADPVVRQVIWTNLLQGVHTSTVDPELLLRAFEQAWPVETDSSLVQTLGVLVGHLLPGFFLADVDDTCARLAAAADLKLSGATGVDAVVPARVLARFTRDESRLRRWMSGNDLPEALADDQDFRWIAVHSLAWLGLLSEQDIEAHAETDHTMTGAQAALGAKAARPTAAAKDWAWTELTTNEKLSNYEAASLAGSFFDCADPSLVQPYIERYFTDVPPLAERFGEFAVARLAEMLFPRVPLATQTLELTDRAIEGGPGGHGAMTSGVRRALVDSRAVVAEALASRAHFPK